MEIKTSLTNHAGEQVEAVYKDIDSIEEVGDRTIKGVHAFCFYKGKLVVVYDKSKDTWTPVGGSVEAGESYEEAVCREAVEEANMKVIKQMLIGCQDFTEKNGLISLTRSVCIVEPYGDFVSDPDGDITEIKLIDPTEYKSYFDWGSVGDRLMERALLLKKELEK